MKFLVTLIFGLIFGLTLAAEWYETASFYQVYPQSFFDDGSGGRQGFGSLKGIEKKLDYLKDLGIDCIWLNPVFESKSFRAFGYDITDYMKIDPRYGSMADFDSLVKAVHDKDMKIIVDFVPNHCAADNPIFENSVKNADNKDDWFVWTKTVKESGTRVYPSNWQSIGGAVNTAWNENSDKTKIGAENVDSATEDAFYYAQFSGNMPDFNFRNDKVVVYFEEVMKFWLDKKVDGFRIDAISHLFEAAPSSGKYEDEAENPDADNSDPTNFDIFIHSKTQDQPETFELVYRWRAFLDKYSTDNNVPKKIMMTESYSSTDAIKKYYQSSDETKQGANLPFNFELITKISTTSKANDIVKVINDWFGIVPTGKVTNWAIGNHDRMRVASRLGDDRVDLMNTLVTMLKGTSVTYYGEEIGMADSCAIYDDTRELNGHECTSSPQKYSDAWVRAPMPWSNATNGGFSTHTETWLPVSKNYKTVNVEAQKGKDKSHFEIYKQLMKLRKHDALTKSENFEIKALGTNSFGFTREFKDSNKQSVFVLINFGGASEKVKIKEVFKTMPNLMTVEIANGKSKRKKNDQFAIDGELTVDGYESLVLFYNSSMTFTISKIVLILTIFIRFIFV